MIRRPGWSNSVIINRRGYIGLKITTGSLTFSDGAAISFSFVAVSQNFFPALGLCPYYSSDAVKPQGLLVSKILKGSLQYSKLQTENGKAILDSLNEEVPVIQKENVSFWVALNFIMKPNQKMFILGYLLKSPEFWEVEFPWIVKN